MEIKKNEALGQPMLTTKVDMSVFVRTLVYGVRTAAQSVTGATAWVRPNASEVLVQVPKPLLLPEMVLLVELVLVSMPDSPVDQTDPLTRSVPNP